MQSFDIRIRILLIVGLVLICLFLLWPPRETINLGLDLKGGIHLVLRVKTDDAVKAEIDLGMERVRGALEEAGLTPGEVRADGVDVFTIAGLDPGRVGEARDLLRAQFPQFRTQQVGAGRIRLSLTAEQASATRDSAVRQVLETIRNRIDKFGVAEPTIQRQGIGPNADRILVQLPGVEDPERVKDLIGSPAFLEWKLVKVPPGITADRFRAPDNPGAVEGMFGGTLPEDVEILPQETTTVDGRPLTLYWPVTRSSPITGNDLKNARRDIDRFGSPAVNFLLRAEAGRRFQALTRENQGQLLAIVLDRKIISAPRINAVIADSGIIEGGNFTVESAEDLALKLRSGALPAGMEILEERTVGPSLGADSIRQGVVASIIGGIIVVLFMLIYYRLSGANATLALALNLLILLGAMAYVRSTLTLPGIAGIALTVGIAVDANVLVFERIREELRMGRTVRAAIHAGFQRAQTTILDSNLTTLIAGIFLYAYGTGPVKGFAVTLNVGILANLFTAIFVSRSIFDAALTLNPRAGRLSI
ncbi:MAG: protein translocase subunit SecD [Acidobacteriota bacterium]